MAARFVSVKDDDQIEALAALADEIWNQYWPGIITKEQTDKMVARYQSPAVIADQIGTQGFEYYLINDDDKSVGYFSLEPIDDEKVLHAKLYVSQACRGQGFSSDTFTYLEGLCEGRKLDAIWLAVNKNSRRAIDIYRIRSFATERMETREIGADFDFDDFMTKKHIW